jgi:hypothetical protein
MEDVCIREGAVLAHGPHLPRTEFCPNVGNGSRVLPTSFTSSPTQTLRSFYNFSCKSCCAATLERPEPIRLRKLLQAQQTNMDLAAAAAKIIGLEQQLQVERNARRYCIQALVDARNSHANALQTIHATYRSENEGLIEEKAATEGRLGEAQMKINELQL